MRYKTTPELQAELFLEKYDITELDEINLKHILYAQGYTVIEFDADLSGENVQRMVTKLKLEELTKKSVCFTYSDKSYKLIFLKSELSSEEKTEALAREQWKIILGKFDNLDEGNTGIAKHESAKAFAYHILHPSVYYKFKHFLHHNHIKIFTFIALASLVVAIILLR